MLSSTIIKILFSQFVDSVIEDGMHSTDGSSSIPHIQKHLNKHYKLMFLAVLQVMVKFGRYFLNGHKHPWIAYYMFLLTSIFDVGVDLL